MSSRGTAVGPALAVVGLSKSFSGVRVLESFDLSIIDNLSFNSGFPCQFGTIRAREARVRVSEDLRRLGLSLDPRRLVGSLSSAPRTGVAVARAIPNPGGGTIKALVFDEIFQLADSITVLRDGRKVAGTRFRSPGQGDGGQRGVRAAGPVLPGRVHGPHGALHSHTAA